MFKLIVVASFAIVAVRCAPQLNDIELKEQAFNRINEAEYDYKWDLNPGNLQPFRTHFKRRFRFSLSDGHEQEQQRKEVDGAHVVIGFYKYIGKSSLSALISV